MTMPNPTEPLKPGTIVKILLSGYGPVQIAEYLGPFGAQGARVYKVLVSKKPRMYTTAPENDLEILDHVSDAISSPGDCARQDNVSCCTASRNESCYPAIGTEAAIENQTEPLKPGTVVKIRLSGYGPVHIAEYLGAFGPKGARIYRILVSRKPRMYTEVREDQLEVLSTP
jgi:hypothetical protein